MKNALTAGDEIEMIKRIKLYCAIYGIPLSRLATGTGLTRQTLHRIWKTERATVDNVEKILSFLELSVIFKKNEKKS